VFWHRAPSVHSSSLMWSVVVFAPKILTFGRKLKRQRRAPHPEWLNPKKPRIQLNWLNSESPWNDLERQSGRAPRWWSSYTSMSLFFKGWHQIQPHSFADDQEDKEVLTDMLVTGRGEQEVREEFLRDLFVEFGWLWKQYAVLGLTASKILFQT